MKREWNDTEEIHEHQSLLRRPSKKEVFNGYYFDKKVKAPAVLSLESRIEEADEIDSPEDNILAGKPGAEAADLSTAVDGTHTPANSLG